MDGKSLAVLATVAVGRSPRDVVINTATHRIYVANLGDNTVSVLEEATNRTLITIPVGQLPSGPVVNPATSQVSVAAGGDRSVSVIQDVPGHLPVRNVPSTSCSCV